MSKRVYDEKLFYTIVESQIDSNAYHQTITELINKKSLLINESDVFKRKDKLYRYMLGKGYESELVAKALHSI